MHDKGAVKGRGVRVSKQPVTLASGAVYEGEWIDDMRDGYGKQEWPDGSKYEGNWRVIKLMDLDACIMPMETFMKESG